MINALVVALLLFANSSSGMQRYSGPKCLGPFCIDPMMTRVSKLFKQLGSSKQPGSQLATYCYQSKDGRAFLFIEIIDSEPDIAGDVLLSDFPNCVHLPTRLTADDLHAWKTLEGIGLGSLETDVLKAYGKPSGGWKIDSTDLRTMRLIVHGYRSGDSIPHVGDRVITYAGDVTKDLRGALFGIRSGRVAWIQLSRNE
jgi:hypothetical protein